MIILGKNTDDKGTQLELLTKKILEELGYNNVSKSIIGAGGEELDVVAEYTMPKLGLDDPLKKKILCECKAHRTPNNLNDWLKFLGKIYFEEIHNNEVMGYFIALSGVNGNVKGHYDSIRKIKKNITLIDGDGLIESVSKIYKICNIEKIYKIIKSKINNHIIKTDILYYDDCVYWLIIFDEAKYTIFKFNGDMLETSKVQKLKELVNESNVTSYVFIDINEEEKAIIQKQLLCKKILAILFTNKGKIELNDVGETDRHTQMDIDEAIKLLETNNLIDIKQNILTLVIKRSKKNNDYYKKFCELIYFVLNGEIDSADVYNIITSELYNDSINKKLFDEIKNIQGNLNFSDREITKIIQLLKLSPSALYNSIIPQPMLIRSKNETNKYLLAHYCNYYLKALYGYLTKDFQNQIFAKYFYEFRQLREIESIEQLKIKNDKKIVIKDQTKIRKGIGKAADELGGGYLTIITLNTAPEPWNF